MPISWDHLLQLSGRSSLVSLVVAPKGLNFGLCPSDWAGLDGLELLLIAAGASPTGCERAERRKFDTAPFRQGGGLGGGELFRFVGSIQHRTGCCPVFRHPAKRVQDLVFCYLPSGHRSSYPRAPRGLVLPGRLHLSSSLARRPCSAT